MNGPLTQKQRRDILEAVMFARHKGRELNTPIDVQPIFLDCYPDDDIGRWFRDCVLDTVAEWFRRNLIDGAGKPLRWHGIATRENYTGHRREHLHVVLWCPEELQGELLAYLRRRFPGNERPKQAAFYIPELNDGEVKRNTRKMIDYRLKQSAGNAAGPLRSGRPTPEKKSRHDGAMPALVLGKRYTISRSLDINARTRSGWQQRHEEAKAREKADRAAREREEEDRRNRHEITPMSQTLSPGTAPDLDDLIMANPHRWWRVDPDFPDWEGIPAAPEDINVESHLASVYMLDWL